jgi:hypothetical protein
MKISILTDEIRKVYHKIVTKEVWNGLYVPTPDHSGEAIAPFLNEVSFEDNSFREETIVDFSKLCKLLTLPFSNFSS